ncbi:tetratricopeptide repeat protein, partial [candidate division CSSED10-310 bacterium]
MNDLPHIIDGYQILEPLGQGGMGVVYRGQHQETGEIVALKTIRGVTETQVHSIRREIRALARIRHQGIIRILNEGVHQGLPWYAMEFIEGATLREIISQYIAHTQREVTLGVTIMERDCEKQKKLAAPTENQVTAAFDVELEPKILPQHRSLVTPLLSKGSADQTLPAQLPHLIALIRQICAPLAYLHGQGIVHRDIKPENIIIRESGQPVLVDFGIMVRFSGQENREILLIERGSAGTANYMAPEQIRNEFADARVDLYALGCILYEIVTGEPPFASQDLNKTLLGHLHEVPPPPSDLPLELEELILRLLAKDPRDRLGHADIVASQLAKLTLGESTDIVETRAQAYLYRSRIAGRELQLSELNQQSSLLWTGKGNFVLIGGVSGVGKTRLALEFASVALQQDIKILTGECSEMAGKSFEAMLKPLQAIADHCRQRGKAETDHLIGPRGKAFALYEPSFLDLPGQELYPELEQLQPASAKVRLFNYLAETLRLLAAKSPLLLFFDDLQWVDDLGLEFLTYLIQIDYFSKTAVMITGLYRTESIPEGFQQIIEAPGVKKIYLKHLDEEALSTIVSDMLAITPAPPLLSKYLARHSEGNPYFVVEYLRAAVESGVLVRNEQGIWKSMIDLDLSHPRVEMYEALTLPLSLQGLIDRRLKDLPGAAHRIIKAAAIVGREVSMLLIRFMTEIAAEELLDATDALFRCQVFEKTTTDNIRFCHSKIREVALSRIDPAERKLLHRMAAKNMEALFAGTRDAHLADLAFHWVEAGEVSKARFYYLEGARLARDRYAYGEAERLYLEFLSRIEKPDLESINVRNELGATVYYSQGRNKEALIQHEQELKEAQALQARSAEAKSLLSLGAVHWARGYIEEAVSLCEKALLINRELGAQDEEARTLGNLAALYQTQGHPHKALSLYEQAVSIARTENDIRSLGVFLGNFALLQSELGNLTAARSLNRQALKIARSLGNRRSEGINLNNLAHLHLAQSEIDEARKLYQQVLIIFQEIGDRMSEGRTYQHLAHLSLKHNQFSAALSYAGKALCLNREVGDTMSESKSLTILGQLHEMAGRWSEACQHYEGALKIAHQIGDRKNAIRLLRSLGDIFRQQHDVGTAEEKITAARELAKQINDVTAYALTLCSLGQ